MKKQNDNWKRLVGKLAKHYNFPKEDLQRYVLDATFDTRIRDLDGFLSLWIQSLPILDSNRPKSVKLEFRYDCNAVIGRHENGKFHFAEEPESESDEEMPYDIF